ERDAVGVPLAQPDVDDRHLRLDVHRHGEGLFDTASLGDDLDVRLVAEKVAEPAADQFVVVDEQYLDRHTSRLRGREPWQGRVVLTSHRSAARTRFAVPSIGTKV